MAIYITGDTHGGINARKLYSSNFPNYKNLTRNDYLIIAGDFGYVWDNSEIEKNLRKEINNKKFTTLFVDGNHENFELLNTFPIINKFNGRARQIDDNIFQLLRGEIYEIDNKKILTFGGASSIDKECRQEGISWWKEELPNYAEIDNLYSNLEKHNNKVDIVITHTCPSGIIEAVVEDENRYGYDLCNKLFEDVRESIEFDKWYFGHFHKDMEIGKYRALFDNVDCIGK
jgi:DNA repair exonuclease SbcCD nuclease subunit